MSSRCPSGQILRSGYRRKSYRRSGGVRVSATRVSSHCIKDVGRVGKGPKLIGPLKKGALHRYGYDPDNSEASRHSALDRAVRAEGLSKIVKRLNAVRVFTKNTNPRLSAKYNADMSYIERKYPSLYSSPSAARRASVRGSRRRSSSRRRSHSGGRHRRY